MTLITPPSNEQNAPDCPMCGKKMTPTANANLFLCKLERSVYMPEFGQSIKYYDCAVEVNPKGGYVFQQYTMPPFRVKIRGYEPRGTSVEKIVKLLLDLHFEQADPAQDWKEIFNIPGKELNLPWHDPDKCVERLNKLIVFS